MAEEIERIYVIPLKKNGFKSSKAAPSAVKRVKSYLTRHMKVEEKDIWIDDSLNNALWSKGKYKMASKIRVKAVKFDDGVVEAYLPELEFKKSRRELLKEEKAKKEPILKKEEMEGEGEGETGTEDYEIAPAADGDVKIKKKKAPKSEKDKKPAEKKPAKAKEKPKKKDTKTEPAKKKPAAKKTTKKESKPKTAKKTASKPKATKKKSTSQKKK
jgi:large subunit ribosomal protein L31e